MSAPNTTSPLQQAISQIERALDVLHPANDREVQLRLAIEEAVEIGYEAVYQRSETKCRFADVLPFRARTS